MKVDIQLIDDLAHLARLQFAEEEKKDIQNKLNEILDWVEQLEEVDTTDTEPLIHISTEMNVLRADQVANVLPHEQALKNAPQKDSDYFRVPKVIE